MTHNTKVSVATIITVLVLVLAGVAAYSYYRRHAVNTQKPTAGQQQAQAPKWIDVEKGSFPPMMIMGVPLPKVGTVVTDRYYIGTDGTIHGEYSYSRANSSSSMTIHDIFIKDFASTGMKDVVDKGNVITTDKDNHQVTITFTPDSTNTLVDIAYTYATK